MKVEGSNAIVTGASAGIGRATATMLAERGANSILAADIDESGLSETCALIEKAGATAIAKKTDVTSTPDLAALYAEAAKRVSRLDIVFNNAGIVSGPPPFPDTPYDRVKRLVDINLTSVIISSQMAVEQMKDRGGVIINTASTGGLTPYLADAPYAASKAAVIMFSRSCADLKTMYNIRVNAVCPGVTETPILEKLGGGQRPDWLQPLMENIQVLQPENIASAVVGLIEDEEKFGEYVVVENKPLGPNGKG